MIFHNDHVRHSTCEIKAPAGLLGRQVWKVRAFAIRYMTPCLFNDDMSISLQKVTDQKAPNEKMACVTGKVFPQRQRGSPTAAGALVKSTTNPEVSVALLAAVRLLNEGYVRRWDRLGGLEKRCRVTFHC